MLALHRRCVRAAQGDQSLHQRMRRVCTLEVRVRHELHSFPTLVARASPVGVAHEASGQPTPCAVRYDINLRVATPESALRQWLSLAADRKSRIREGTCQSVCFSIHNNATTTLSSSSSLTFRSAEGRAQCAGIKRVKQM